MANFQVYLFTTLSGILVIGVVVVTARYLREMGAARERLARLGSQVIQTAYGPVEYARAGQGYPVLVVHGAMGGFDAGLMLAKPVIEAGFQAISVSRFGYLRSPIPDHASVDRQVDALDCLLDVLGIRQAAVLTVSGGATASIRFAARCPERVSALILVSPAAPGKVKVAPPPKALFDHLLRSDFAYWAFITYLKPVMQRVIGVPKGFILSPEMEAVVNYNLALTLPASQRMDGFIFDNFRVTAEFYEEISETSACSVDKIKAPVLVINAADDPLAAPENVRGMAEKFPNARLFLVPDGGHLLLGHAAEVNAAVTQFLRSCTGEPSISR